MSRDNGLQCELCEMWFHSACEGIDDEVYKVLCKSESVHWFCKKCNTGVTEMLKSIGKMMDRVNDVENRLTAMQIETKKEIGDIKHAIGNNEARVNREVMKKVEHHVCLLYTSPSPRDS